MPNQNDIKGRQLEKAVRMIQENLLEVDQRLKGTKFIIEPRKIIKHNGVRHEIDIWVQTQVGTVYEAVWFFECKNWEAAVDKNEVLILNYKVEALGAAKGFLVAPSFTSDAKAQAAVFPRIKLVECSTEFSNQLSIQMFGTAYDFIGKSCGITPWGEKHISFNSGKELMEEKCLLDGQLVLFGDLFEKALSELRQQDAAKNHYLHLHRYNYYGHVEHIIPFKPSQLLIKGIEVAFVSIYGSFFVDFYKYRLVSKFELPSMGRACTFEYDDPAYPEDKCEVDLILKI